MEDDQTSVDKSSLNEINLVVLKKKLPKIVCKILTKNSEENLKINELI